MLNENKIVVVMPAYNAARTLRQTYEELPFDIVDEGLLVDDSSSDETVTLARELNVTIFQHKRNLGYGRNQKTCYREALKRGADIVIMLHPDYQYSPKLVTSLAGTFLKFRMRKAGFARFRLFDPERVKLFHAYYHELHK